MEGLKEAGGRRMGDGRGVLPLGPIVDGMFVVVATTALALVGMLAARSEVLGIEIADTPVAGSLPGWGVTALGIWMVIVGIVALALPVLALVVWGRYVSVRLALLPYVLVVGVQILVEIVFAAVFVPNMVVLVGLIYTGYRLRQLLAARKAFVATGSPKGYGRAAVTGVLSLGLVFWSANLVFLLFVALPRVVQVS
ncbi:MAG: hypothetical protein ACRDTR_13885 [Rubrobacter sp.]